MNLLKKMINKINSYFKSSKPVVKQEVPIEPLKSINKKDVEQLILAFPPFIYRKGMTHDEIVTETMKCNGEQRVLQFILSRIQGRSLAGPQYDR